MCFSAEASFGAGALLLGIGIATVSKAETGPHKLLASIPLLFAIQQFDEGLLWLTFSNAAYMQWQQLSIYIFLLFAQVIWPVFLPLSILLIEKDPVQKKILRITLGIGILLSAYLLYCLFAYDVTAVISDHHIRYDLAYPYARTWYNGLVYFIPTIVAPLASGNKKMQLMGGVILVAYLISRVFYNEYLISIWCYFATAISVIVWMAILEFRKDRNAGHSYSPQR